MNDVKCLYPNEMKKSTSNINKSDVDRLFEVRKLLGNHWLFSLWGAFIGDNDE